MTRGKFSSTHSRLVSIGCLFFIAKVEEDPGVRAQELRERPSFGWRSARIQPLDNETPLDPEEERLREAKVLEEARKRDKERMAKETDTS